MHAPTPLPFSSSPFFPLQTRTDTSLFDPLFLSSSRFVPASIRNWRRAHDDTMIPYDLETLNYRV